MSHSTKYDKYQHFYIQCSHGNNICAHKIIDEYILRLDVANTKTTGSNKAIFNKIYAKFKGIDLTMCVCFYQICEKSAFLCRVLTWKNVCAKTIIEECILTLNVANTMSTGSSKAIFIIIYAIYKEKDLKMCVA